MKTIIATIALMLSSCLSAGELAQKFEELASRADVGHGVAYTDVYEPGSLDVDFEVSELDHFYNQNDQSDNHGCHYLITVGGRYAYEAAFRLGERDQLGRALKKLYRRSKIMEGITVEWDKKSGSALHCKMDELRIYGTDGDLLVVEYKHIQ